MTIVHCNSHGVPLQVRISDEFLLPQLARLLPFGTVIGASHDPEAQTFLLSPSVSSEQFTRDVMVYVANHGPDRVFLHAGVVGWQGRALLLPGPSFAGKTTLTAALVQAGATYYSDEYALIDHCGWVHPYPRDLQIRKPRGETQTSVPISALRGCTGEAPLRVALVVFAEYEAGALWDPQTVSHGLAVLEMLRHAIPVQRTPARVMSSLSEMLKGATACRSKRGEASLTARLLLASLDRIAMASAPAEPAGYLVAS
jgi:hypothetical protein